MRAAIYYAPAPADPLWQAGCTWLGRDPETAATVPQPLVPGIAAMTREPAAYGFHATLKPPMRLQTSYAALLGDVRALAAMLPPFALPELEVSDLSGFVALREAAPCPALHSLADACVEHLDRHRAPPDAAELARRREGNRLSPEADAMLVRWGYPYVFRTWFFHMTLTSRIPPERRAPVMDAARAHFAPALAQPRLVDAISIFTQAGPGAPFLVAERLPLEG